MNEQNKQVPTLRFRGFTDDWEQRKLGEISQKVTRKSPDNAKLPVLTNSAEKGIIRQDSFFDKKIAQTTKNYYIVENNNFVYNPRISKTAPYGPIRRNTLGFSGAMSPLYYVFQVNSTSNSFLEQYFKSDNWYKFMYKNGDSGARSDRFAIKDSVFVQMPISIPAIPEQRKIANLLFSLDNIIFLQQRKLDLLKQLKKGLLQKMFADKDSKRPILRFSGFTKDWKQCKLGKLARIDTGKLNANAMVMDGKYDFYTSGKEKYKIDKYAFVGPAITVAGNGATVGYMHYADNKFNAYQRTYVLTNLKGDRRFLFNTIQANLPHKIYQESRTGNIPYIVLDMLTDLSIMIPLKEEQTSIGNFVNVMDNFITAQENRLNSSKLTKKFLLQKLFI